MAQSLSQIIVHTIFSTKNRVPFLADADLRHEMHRVIGGILRDIECQPLVIGGAHDHVHILNLLARTCDPSAMVREMKRGSSLWIKSQGGCPRDFAWQNGYGMFSLGHSQIDATRRYILNQEEHHRKVSFQDEFRRFLKRYEIVFDERYVWD